MKWIPAFLMFAVLSMGMRLSAQEEAPPQYGYLLERVTVPADNGSLSYPPATRVVILGEKEGGKVTVGISGRSFDVASAQLTLDSSVAQALLTKMAEEKRGSRKAGAAAGARSKNAASPDKTAAEKLLALQMQDFQSLQGQIDRDRAALQSTPHKGNNARQGELKNQMDALKRQHDKILEQERQLMGEMKQGHAAQ